MTVFRLFVVFWMTIIAVLPMDNDVLVANKCVKCSTAAGDVCCPS